MTAQQLNYAIQKAKFESIESEIKPYKTALNAEINKSITVEQWADAITKLEHDSGYINALEALKASESELIKSTQNIMQSHKDYQKIAPAFERTIFNPGLRNTLINICMKLEVK